MSNSGVNQAFAKCFIVFMAIVILVEGVVYLGLSVWGLALDNCSEQTTDFSKNPFKVIIDLIYFASEECDAPGITVPPSPTVSITMDWAKSFIITNRMYIFMIVYAVVSGLWIITSLMVLFTICSRLTNCVLAVCFWPWFLVVIGGSILDAVATGYHVHDIIHTTTSKETFDYIGASISEEAMTILEKFDPYFVTPAIVMTCISCRVVLIWLLNIFGTSFCLSLSRSLAKRNATNTRDSQEYQSSTATVQATQAPLTVQSVEWVPQQPQPQNPAAYPQQIRPKPLPIQTTEPLNLQGTNAFNQGAGQQQYDARSREPYQSPAPVVAAVVYPVLPPAADNNARQNDLNRQQSSSVNDITTYRNTDTHPDRLDYPAHQQAPSVAAAPTAPPQSAEVRSISEELSAISPLNNRYSGTENPLQNQGASQQQPQRVSAELRSQLPWSYTSMATKPPPVPRKPQPQQQQLQIYPEIPEPDYGDQPSNGSRPQTSGSTSANAQQSYSRW